MTKEQAKKELQNYLDNANKYAKHYAKLYLEHSKTIDGLYDAALAQQAFLKQMQNRRILKIAIKHL